MASTAVYDRDQIKVLSFSDDYAERCIAAVSPFADPEMLERLVHDGSSKVRAKVAQRKDLPSGLVALLAHDDTPHVKLTLAKKSVTLPAEVMEELAKDSHYAVRLSVASRKDITSGICQILKKDLNNDVREALCRNLSTAPEALVSLSYDKYVRNRALVAANPNTPPKTISRFAKSKQSLESLAALQNPSCPPKILEQYSQSADMNIQRAISANPNTPIHVILTGLHVFPPNNAVITNLLSHPDLTLEALEAAVESPNMMFYALDRIIRRLMRYSKYSGMPREWVEAQLLGEPFPS